MDFSFSGAGFMGCYYFGVVNCLNKYIPRDRVRRAAGASAGSLIAAYYLMDLPLDACLKEIIELTEDVRSRPLGVFDRSNQIVDLLPRVLDRLFPEDAHKRVSGRLFVAMTRLRDMKCVIVNEFETRQDLIDALNCSCFIPVWSGNHVSTYKGVKYIDGGFTNNLPVFDEHTVRVCCFSGASDISPYDRAHMDLLSASVQGMPVNLTWNNMRRMGRALWPPPASYIIGLLERGFHDTKNFILTHDLIQCWRCYKATETSFRRQVAPTISPAASPAVSRANSFVNLTKTQVDCNDVESDNNSATQKETALSKTSSLWFETNRSRSGKLIKSRALELGSVEYTKQKKRQQEANGKSFAVKLREKLQSIASTNKHDNDEGDVVKQNLHNVQLTMPTIIVEEYNGVEQQQQQQQVSGDEEDDERASQKLVTISDIMTERAREDSSTCACEEDSKSSSASDDSAIGLSNGSGGKTSTSDVTDGAKRRGASPADKYLASGRETNEQILKSELEQFAQQKQSLLPDRFAFAPGSQLPSCPPSPNLNRHCGECIRLRQCARMDEIDETIKREALKYGQLKSKNPEKEFNGIKFKLSNWFRQLSGSKYSYSLDMIDDEFKNVTNEMKRVTGKKRESVVALY